MKARKQNLLFFLMIVLSFVFGFKPGWSWPVPDTGQTQSYTSNFGEDSDYLINPPSFTKLDEQGNDLPDNAASWVMVRDNVTGLIWEVKNNSDGVADYSNPHDADNTYTWYDSNPDTNGGYAGTSGDGTDTEDFIADLNNQAFGGKTDWRLPTIRELVTIVNYRNWDVRISVSYFLHCKAYWYWTMNTNSSNAGSAFSMDFSNAFNKVNMTKSAQCFVRAVHGELSRNSLDMIPNNDSSYTDIDTGLMWGLDRSRGDWNSAINDSEDFDLNEFSDWRLPTVKELFSLVGNDGYGIRYMSFYDYHWGATIQPSSDNYRYVASTSYGSISIYHYDQNYYYFPVRGGQNIIEGNLVISTPRQADIIPISPIGTQELITWDSLSLGGDVSIELSIDGGKTFSPLVESTPNEGAYTWTISGPYSHNCMLKVTPLNDPDKAASVSFFTMDFLKGFSLYSAVDSLQEYDLGLFLSLQNIGEREFPAEWHLSDPEVARFFEGALHAEKNGCAFLSTDYRGRTYSQMVCFKTQMDDFETELNETPESANALTEGVFVDGNMFDEKDYFALEIEEDTYIQAAYYNEGDTADTRMEILSADGEVLASAVSTDGTDVMLPVGLRAGIYYIRLTPNGDIDDVSFYSLIYKTGSAIDIGGLVETEGNNEPATATTLPMDSCLTGKLATPEDLDVYLVDLDSTTYINLYFESAEGTKPYDLFIYNQIEQNPITRITVEAAQEFTMPLGLRPGKYYIQVSGADLDGDDLHRYQLCVQEFQAENYEVESNNTPLYGNSLPSEAPIQGRITYSRDVDYFGFTTQESGYIQMAFTPSSETGDYTIQLMGEDGIPFFPIHSLDGAEKPLNMSQAPGRYYVKISAYQGGDVDNQSDYTLSFVSGLPIEGLTTLLGVSIEAPETELEVDGGMQLKAWGHYSGDSQDLTNQVTWTSLSPDIADVDASGLVTGYGEGSATIVASAGKYSDQASLSVGEAATYAHSRGNLIIVAGGGVSSDNTLRESTQYLCNQLYLTYKRRGFDDDDIYYLNTVTQIDLDGDGYWDAIVDSSAPAASALEYAITEFAANENTNGPLAVYLNGHGGSGSFQIMPDDILSASQMDAWLDEFQAATDRQVIVIIESCKSGSFAGDILSSGENRIVLSSTGDLDSYVNLAGAASFSQFLSDRLLLGDSLSQAYLKAAQSLSALGEPYAGMTPLLLQGLDGLASSAFVGGNFAIASPFPAFTDQTVNQEIDASAVLDIFAAVTALDDLESVWAVVTPPDYQRPETGQDFDAPETGLPIIILEGNDDNGAWEGTYEDFAYNGQHRFVFYAKSIYGNVAVSPVTIITVKNGENLGEPGDLDGDGLLTIKDMILGLRILCGLEDESGFPQGADVNEDGALGLEEIVFLLNNM